MNALMETSLQQGCFNKYVWVTSPTIKTENISLIFAKLVSFSRWVSHCGPPTLLAKQWAVCLKSAALGITQVQTATQPQCCRHQHTAEMQRDDKTQEHTCVTNGCVHIVCVYVYIYIHIYIQCLCIYICVFIYIYILIYSEELFCVTVHQEVDSNLS